MTAQQRKARKAPARKQQGNRWVFPAVVIGLVLVFAVVIAITALSSDDDGGGGGEPRTEVAAEVDVTGTPLPDLPDSTSGRSDPAVGMAAPTLASVDFDDNPVEAGGATGQPYALVFLAHWCPHCQAEVPRLVAVAEDGAIEGVGVTAVVTGTSDAQSNYPPSAWLAREDWPFDVLVDDASASAAAAYGLTAYPFLVFVDAEGNVAGRLSGEVSEADLTRIFRALAAGELLPIPGAGGSSSS